MADGAVPLIMPCPLPLDGSVIKMKGLPFKASADDVARFFEGFSLKSDDVFLKRHPGDGRPNGEVRPC